jgi:hypothetical protein
MLIIFSPLLPGLPIVLMSSDFPPKIYAVMLYSLGVICSNALILLEVVTEDI